MLETSLVHWWLQPKQEFLLRLYLMALFVEHISTLSADITTYIKSKVTEWMLSQASFIQALFGNICWES